jgi:YidC/Oxa1 family membrane protein insertase
MMNNLRVFLWLGLALLLWINFETWQRDYAPPVTVTPASTAQAASQAAVPQAAGGVSQTTTTTATSSVELPATDEFIEVQTDVLRLQISLQGGSIQRADLVRYPKVKNGSEPVRLMNADRTSALYLLQTGLTGPSDTVRPTHLTGYSAQQRQYRLESGTDELQVPLLWRSEEGVTVRKTFTFKPGQYQVKVQHQIVNRSANPWQAAPYARILREEPPQDYSMFNVESYAFRGPALYDGAKYRKLSMDDSEDRNLALDVSNGWVAALQHHFVSAIVPPANAAYRYTVNPQGAGFSLAAAGPMSTVQPGMQQTLSQVLFLGPKLQAQLEQAGPKLELVADYGKLTVLASPLFWLLEKVHGLLGNWGWAIVVVTFLLKLLFYPLSEASGKSMAKMKVLAPRMKNLQETHKNDREKLGRAMMDLYQREKVNPAAGCLPILIQIPVFLAFYWVLLESVEMRQAPFMGWINDLSARDPWFILPLIMAVAMFIQYKLNPTPPDPLQAKIFMIMPIVMSISFAWFPAGLVLYWVTNTILSIAQQWNINRRIEAAKSG